MTPPRSVSIGHTITAVIAIVGIALLIFFWPTQQENVSTEQTSELVTSSISSSDTELASSAYSSDSSDAFDIVSSSASTPVIKTSSERRYENTETGFSFWYADDMTVTAPTSFVLEKGEIGYQINDPVHFGEIWVVLSPDPTQKSNGAVRIEEVYSAPGGNLSKNYVLYTGTYKVEVYAHYDVFPLYEDQLQPRSDLSLLDLVIRDLGGDDVRNPIERLMAVYPNEKSLIEFFHSADNIVASMKVAE
jgi:hypothetical protein